MRLDDVLGAGAWLITAVPSPDFTPDVMTLHLDDARLDPSRAQIRDWLTAKEAQAVLVRPDRYVFGTGAPDRLMLAWTDSLDASVRQNNVSVE